MRQIPYIDSHTEGEPTRVVEGRDVPLVGQTLAERVLNLQSRFESEFRPMITEPRAFDAVVGAWIGEPTREGCLRDVIFFNPAGTLGMCGHGTIGIMVSIAFLGLEPGIYQLNTPVGVVAAELVDRHCVRVQNVVSRRIAKDVTVHVDDFGDVMGDVAWGGNTFFLVKESPYEIELRNLGKLERFSKAVMAAARHQGFPEVNHVELFGPPTNAEANSKNYVLCPGGEYDRSPCGTGTSAKMACLAADGKLKPNEVWIQESIIGTLYRGWYAPQGDAIKPTIEGRAYVTGTGKLVFEGEDPMAQGIVK